MRGSKWTSIVAAAGMLAIPGCADRDPLSSTGDELAGPAGKAVSQAVAGSCETCGPWPELVPFPKGFGPEGIAAGKGNTFYAGSISAATLGQILVGDLRTGRLTELVAPNGKVAIGMKYDPRSNLLFVATRGPAGANVFDGTTGALVANYPFEPSTAAINDVILTSEGAYFSNSSAAAGAFLYKIALGPNGQPGASSRMALPAAFAAAGTCTVGPALTGNGLAVTSDGAYLIIAHMSAGSLYRMSVATQVVEPITLTGGDACTSDGLLLDGSTLYVAQNFLNRVAVISMSSDFLSGTVTRHITEPFLSHRVLQIPTTLADFGDYIYGVTGGFAGPTKEFAYRLEK